MIYNNIYLQPIESLAIYIERALVFIIAAAAWDTTGRECLDTDKG